MPHTSTRRHVTRVTAAGARTGRQDTLAVEEPLELRIGGEPYYTTMRTPGHDLELALGFLVGEGVVGTGADVVRAAHCPDADGGAEHNVVEVVLAAGVAAAAGRARRTTSACGVCGTRSLDQVGGLSTGPLPAGPMLAPELLAGLPAAMRARQRGFDATGGLHAAALFDAAGRLLCLREDVGRHNALDKVVGWALAAGRLPLHGCVLQVSGRASFELVQKAWLAGCPVLAAVSAPSSLAVDLAGRAGMTLVGFSRGERFTVYAGEQRVCG